MSMAYVRDYYGVPAKRGMRVLVYGRKGTITRATHHVWVRFDGERRSTPCHPCDGVCYLTGGETTSRNTGAPPEPSTNI